MLNDAIESADQRGGAFPAPAMVVRVHAGAAAFILGGRQTIMMRRSIPAYKYAAVGVAAAAILGGLALGWAAEPPVQPPADPDYYEDRDRYESFSNSHIDREYGDCSLGIEAVGDFAHNSTASIDLACNHYLGGGSGGGGSDDRLGYPSLLHFDPVRIGDYTSWSQAGIESCTMQAFNLLRHQENGPSTISIVINCWWFEDQKRTLVESTPPDATPEFLANSTRHALLGVVTQVNPVPVQYNETGAPQVFTDVVIAVNEDLKGEYRDPLITVRVDGGETDTEIVIYESAPKFKVGERVFVFVGDKDPDGAYGDNYHVAGQYQGKYTVTESGLAVNRDHGRILTLDDLRAIVEATLPGDG